MKPTALALSILASLAGCADQLQTDTTEQDVTTDPALAQATTTFTTAVGTATRNAALARGLTLTSPVATGYTPKNTVATAMAGSGTQVFLVGTGFLQDTHKAGLYKLEKTTRGVMLYRFDPTSGAAVLLGPAQPRQPSIGDPEWMCEKAGSDIHDYCDRFVWCAMFGVDCPPELPPYEAG